MNIFKFSLESRSSKAGWFFKKKVVYIYNIVIFDLHSLCQFRIRIYGVTHWKRIKWRTKIYKRKIFLRNLISWPPSYTALLVEMEMDRNCLNIKQPSSLFLTMQCYLAPSRSEGSGSKTLLLLGVNCILSNSYTKVNKMVFLENSSSVSFSKMMAPPPIPEPSTRSRYWLSALLPGGT